MKKILTFATLFVAFSLVSLAQTVHRISVEDNLQTAVNNATNGDVFLVEAGMYGDLTINKKVTLIGTGYLVHPSTTSGVSILGKVKFNGSANGSWMTGFQTRDVIISASNVSVLKNYTGKISLGLNEAESNWNAIADNCIIKQNIGQRLEILAQQTPGRVANFICRNNIFSQGFYLEGVISGQIINNTFDSDISGIEEYISSCEKLNVVFKSNIMTNVFDHRNICPIIRFITDIFVNNVMHSDPQYNTIPAALATTTNRIITDLTNLYVGYPANPNDLALDARNQLAPNSPAKGAGEGGTDAGAFGGDDPYVLSGVPNIPSVYSLNVPSTVSQGGTLQVQIKAKTNN